MFDNDRKIWKSWQRADEIFNDIYFEELDPLCERPLPEDCPFPAEFDEHGGIEYEKEYASGLLDPDCLKALSEASSEDRDRILERCDQFVPDLIKPVLDEGEDDVEVRWGFDVCAWYQPIHYYRQAFGIYIRRRCLIRSARDIIRRIDRSTAAMSPDHLARYCLLGAGFGYLLHEFYHHKVESFGIRLEIAQDAHPRRMYYLEYKSRVYRPLLRSDDPRLLEEALANAYAYRQMAQVPYRKILPDGVFRATRNSLRNGFAHQRGGYGEAENYLRSTAFARGEHELQQQILKCDANAVGGFEKWRNAPDMLRSLFQVKEVPTFIVR